jgi:hypothetical protein
MLRKLTLIMFVLAVALTVVAPVAFATRGGQGGRGDGPIVYVTSQGLYYDSIVTADPLPWQGPFQKLEGTPPYDLYTMYGPGDPGYVGGRWWVDANPNGYQDEYDVYFSCPLLGPGRETKFAQ